MTTDLLQEFSDSRGLSLRVDRTGGVIRGIKILGLRSRNGREYLPEALSRAVALYEGAKVNVNHPKGHPLAPRDYQERIGIIRNVQHRPGEGLFADFHFNPKHQLSEQLTWDAENAPENVGFSHNVHARTARQGETTTVEEIVRVHSVDLVADPATTRGLFESTAAGLAGVASEHDCPNGSRAQRGSLDPSRSEPPAAAESTHAEADGLQSAGVGDERNSEHAAEASRQREETITSLLQEFSLPPRDATDPAAKRITSDTFIDSLLTAADEPTMRRLVEDRAALARSVTQRVVPARQPTSRDQAPIVPILDARTFARAIST
jgi:hypothetical protein